VGGVLRLHERRLYWLWGWTAVLGRCVGVWLELAVKMTPWKTWGDLKLVMTEEGVKDNDLIDWIDVCGPASGLKVARRGGLVCIENKYEDDG